MPDRVLYALSALLLIVACAAPGPELRANRHDWYDCLTDHNRDHRAWMKRCS